MSKTNEITATYSVVLKNWVPKLYGPKPTIEQLAKAHALGCRPGKQALAIAMNLRESGASTAQIVAACAANWGSSGTHNNKRDQLVTAMRLCKTVSMADDTFGHKVYAIALTPKGEAKVKAAVEVPLKAEKPVKAKTVKAEKPVTVTEPLPGVPAEIQQPTVQA